jgi:hypothetical protein
MTKRNAGLLAMKMKDLTRFPWHAILSAVFPILALAANNLSQINLRVVLRPLLISLTASLLLLLILKLILKDWQRAGLLTTIFLVLFFSYGHVYNILHNITVAGAPLARNRSLAPFWLLLAGLAVWIVRSSAGKDWLKSLTRILSLLFAVLVVFQCGSLLWFTYQVRHADSSLQVTDFTVPSEGSQPGSGSLPDIYYIILDSYGRSDVLQASYQINNTAFLSRLQGMGFYVASCSMSNYAQTEMSLATTLNFNYLDSLAPTFTAGQDNNALLLSLIKNSSTRRILEGLGYETIAFATGYYWTEWENADVYYSPAGFWKINAFETMLLRSSAALVLLDSGLLNSNQANLEELRGRTLYVLDKLGSLPPGSKPRFVFVHLIIPHRPFIFGPNGESILVGPLGSEQPYTPEEYKEGYGNQVQYIDSRMLEIVASIISSSRNPPIIILQGDHGPGFSSNQDRMSILNAYYLPGDGSRIYGTITPVNTFRVIFDEYFHGGYHLLPDASYFSVYDDPYEFASIKNDCLSP